MCRDLGRVRTARKARQDYRASDEGRADHRDHQRAYRARLRDQRVGDHGSKKFAESHPGCLPYGTNTVLMFGFSGSYSTGTSSRFMRSSMASKDMLDKLPE